MQTAGADAAMFLLPLVRTKDDIRRKYAVTDGDLYRLFPYRNRLCSVKITRADLDELEMYIADYSKKRKVRFFFAGALKCDSRGKFSLDRESVKIALSDFLLFQIPVLQRKLSMEPGSWRLIPGLFERDVVRQALENGLFPAGMDHSVSR